MMSVFSYYGLFVVLYLILYFQVLFLFHFGKLEHFGTRTFNL